MRLPLPNFLLSLCLLQQWLLLTQGFEVPDSANLSSWALPSCFAPCLRQWCGRPSDGPGIINDTSCICTKAVFDAFDAEEEPCITGVSNCNWKEYWTGNRVYSDKCGFPKIPGKFDGHFSYVPHISSALAVESICLGLRLACKVYRFVSWGPEDALIIAAYV
nr:uncharacterized protein CTRU02_00290 [Colletotrichum truncatum]KAF6801541.1 hypothetical protein CTRU02_00290 [Colletotrichum truncatum]